MRRYKKEDTGELHEAHRYRAYPVLSTPISRVGLLARPHVCVCNSYIVGETTPPNQANYATQRSKPREKRALQGITSPRTGFSRGKH